MLRNNELKRYNFTEQYNSINGLRALAAIGIVLVHVKYLGGGGRFAISVKIIDRVINSLTDLVFLFMIISGFSMCCGYYERISSGKMKISKFYERRYQKILPFFALIVFFGFIASPSLDALFESFANLTLCFGLLPNANISLIGVGWTLGIIFEFYLLFPFFCFLLHSKKRAWFALGVSMIYNILCKVYFLDENHVVADFSDRMSFVFCSMFFLAGGLIYLYRQDIQKFSKRFRRPFLAVILIFAAGFFLRSGALANDAVDYFWELILFSLILMYAIGVDGKILQNKFTKFMSGISFEIYLCHLMIFRVVEKLKLQYFIKNDIVLYLVMFIAVLCGAIIFASCAKWAIAKVENKIEEISEARKKST